MKSSEMLRWMVADSDARRGANPNGPGRANPPGSPSEPAFSPLRSFGAPALHPVLLSCLCVALDLRPRVDQLLPGDERNLLALASLVRGGDRPACDRDL